MRKALNLMKSTPTASHNTTRKTFLLSVRFSILLVCLLALEGMARAQTPVSVTWVNTYNTTVNSTIVTPTDACDNAIGESAALLPSGTAGKFKFTIQQTSGYWAVGLN
jgi:hypothetical protein